MPEKNRFPAVLQDAVFFTTRHAEYSDAKPTLRRSSGDLSQGGSEALVVSTPKVRRLTPRECERLQGFPDDFTLIPYRHGKPAADGPRYKALGNSMAVPVIGWVLNRVRLFSELRP